MNNKVIKNQEGIAIILALIMLLIMSVMALTVSFMSNIGFTSMAGFKKGQEAFIAAETCVREGRKRIETIGVENLFFQLQAVGDTTTIPTSSDIVILENIDPADNGVSDLDDWKGSLCRSGPRRYDSAGGTEPAKFVEIPEPTKAFGRPIKNVSLPSGGSGGASLVPLSFTVVGKDAQDKDKSDSKDKINSGTEIGVGYEVFVPGGATNVY